MVHGAAGANKVKLSQKVLLNLFKDSVTFPFRGGKGKPGASKKGKKNARKESYDLIVNIDMQEWNLTREQVELFIDSAECRFPKCFLLLNTK